MQPMARKLLSDELWESIRPLFPPPRPRRVRYPGRKPLDERKVLTGILFVLKTGIPWDELPVEMRCGSGMSCLNHLRAWQRAGAWLSLRQALQAALPWTERIDWTRTEPKFPPHQRRRRALQTAVG
jgi:transposase